MATGTPGPAVGAPVKLHHRKNVTKMTATQLASYRAAIMGSKAIADDRGFDYWAGIHGLPLPMYCQHRSDLFLPWHRAYLYFFELSLQDIDPSVTLPYWDYSTAASHVGIPPAYAQRSVGGTVNPLFRSKINPLARSQAGGAVPLQTTRQPGTGNGGALPTAVAIQSILGLSDFLDFSGQLEDIHNGVHVWVGGTMSEIPVAAYDPIFFAHHAMIDRIWRLWQLRHSGSQPPASLLGEALPPFQMTVVQTLSVTALGYDYASSTHTVAGG